MQERGAPSRSLGAVLAELGDLAGSQSLESWLEEVDDLAG